LRGGALAPCAPPLTVVNIKHQKCYADNKNTMSAVTYLCKPHKKPYIKVPQVFDLNSYITAGVI